MAFIPPPPSAYRSRARSEALPRRKSSQQSEIARRFNVDTRGTALTEEDFLSRYSCEKSGGSLFVDSGELCITKDRGSKVIVKRVTHQDDEAISAARREIAVLSIVSDESLPFLADWFQLDDTTWTVSEYRPCRSLSQVISANGPLSELQIKTALNQLLSGTVALFMSEFAHLRICADTVYLDEEDQIVIKDFQYVCTYSTEKIDDLYSPTQEKFGSDIYVAPEIFACRTYNARKAVIWSLGVLLYFITTAQTATLSNLNHPSSDPPSPQSSSPSASISQKLILYPSGTSRFTIPSYIRQILPKMLSPSPRHRAELIEVASRIPKDYEGQNTTRPLMEMAWLDYKRHVGPYAYLHVPDTGGAEGGLRSGASSIYSKVSGISGISSSLQGLLGGGRKSERRVSMPGWGRSGR